MKKILVPMDFTAVASNAFIYGFRMYPDALFELIHVSSWINSNSDAYLQPGFTKKGVLITELGKIVMKLLGVDQMPKNVSIEILHGDPIESIKNYVIENSISALVMGTRDKYDVFERWLGTVSLGIVKSIKMPIYLIPKHAKFQGLEQILVATDYHFRDKDFVKKIKDWNENIKAYVKFLNISQNKEDDFEIEKEAIVQEMFKGKDPGFGFEIASTSGNDIGHDLLAVAHNFHADLLIIMPETQSFIQSLLFKSVTKKLIQKSDIPLLFLSKDNISVYQNRIK